GWVAKALGRSGWVHVAPLARSDFPAETLRLLARGRRLLLDGQGLVRPGRTGPLELDADFDPELLRHLSVLKLAEEEAEVIGGVDRLPVPEVVVTLGSRGALVIVRGRTERVAAPAAHGVDPTGAGDAFAAVYLAGRSAGQTPVGAARRATSLVAGLLSGQAR
ncbi:MAG: carbohydrate kinase family protein, partial [Gaiellaceae bacterium]